VKLLCDRNVEQRYVDAFRRADWLEAVRLKELLPIDTDDPDIIKYAGRNGWVVFTGDKRFRAPENDDREDDGETAIDCGVVFYRKLEEPSPDDVVAALRAIAQAYTDNSEIDEYVPGGWI
jgi:hypothetical protein